MKLLTCWTCLVALLAASVVSGAEAKFDAAARAKAAGPIVNDETAVVGHADLSRMTVEEILDFLTSLVPNTLGEIRKSQQQLQGWRDALLQVGVKDVYFTLGPATVLNGPRLGQMSWAIAFSSPLQEKGVRTVLPLGEDEAKTVDGVFAIPEWHKGLRPLEHPELAAAFEAAGDTAVQLLLVLPADAKRVVSELMPELPKELGGGPSSVLTNGICWAAVGIDLPPHKGLRLTVKSDGAASAEALRAKLMDIARTINQQTSVPQRRPEFDKAIAMLTPRVEGDRLTLIVDEKNSQAADEVMSVLRRPIETAQQDEGRRESVNNLKQIGLAMHSYYDANKHFPLQASRSPDGKPLLSWRVHILPYLDQNGLYKQFHLDEPWNSAHNRTLIEKMSAIYRLPVSKNKEPGLTNYLLPVGNGAAFTVDSPTYFKDISDGTAHTIMVVEVDDEHAVTWTKPDDWPFDPNDPAKGLGHFFDGSVNATMCDGSVLTFKLPRDPKDVQRLRALFTRAAGDPIEPW
jgi:hypothetical protein